MTVSLPRARGNRVDLSSFFKNGDAKDDNVTNNESTDKQNGDDKDMCDDL